METQQPAQAAKPTGKQQKKKDAAPKEKKPAAHVFTVECPEATAPSLSQIVAVMAPDSEVKFAVGPACKLSCAGSPDVTGTDMEVAQAICKLAGMAPHDQALLDKIAALNLAAAEDAAIQELNTLLQGKKYLGGDAACLSDAAAFNALNAAATFDVKKCGKAASNVARWFQQAKHAPALKKVPLKKEKPATAADSNKGLAGTKGAYTLKGVKPGDVVVTRFPPEPSGFLHIGHIKAALLNEYFARHYNGTLLLRFDDTNPAKEKTEYVESIVQDLKTVGIVADKVSYTSDYFPQLLATADKMVRDGLAYVDDSPREVMKEERMNGIESKGRSRTVEENLALWEEMKQGSERGQKCVLRAKTDMSNPNKVMRDPALYRCVPNAAHWRTGTQYKCYPLYDFSIPIVDSAEGVTHALRSSEYHDRNELYDWVPATLKLRAPVIEDFSRLNFAYVLLSKRNLKWFVEKGLVDGWHDPRFPTVQGLMRRGLTVEAMREFVLAQGSSKSLNLMQMDKLWAINKKIIDPIVPRYTAVGAEPAPRSLHVTDGPEQATHKEVPRHKKNPSLGMKLMTFARDLYIEQLDASQLKAGDEVTLMDWGNVVIDDAPTDTTKPVTCHLHLSGSVKDTVKLTWTVQSDVVPVELVEYDHLITVPKLDDKMSEHFEDYVNKKSKVSTAAVGDANMRVLNRGDRVQLERRGYFICDVPLSPTSSKVIMVLIPEGVASNPFHKIHLKWQ
eukprot:TRINITY_DN863_c0_g1_i2.p1 TRINITY_DN863_c0_g1~~TRINITY_DN863_c0_g1_i2.p1  ORF type:complete len:731 (-),score=242.51 TRINITY_DN863_c0_g1_i2:57-2249(-)